MTKEIYFTPSNLYLSPPSSPIHPLQEMDAELSDKIKLTVNDILKTSDIDSTTEKQVRDLASEKLGIELSDLSHKVLVRQTVESFLLAIDDDDDDDDDDDEGEGKRKKPVLDGKQDSSDSWRVICKLSEQSDVAVKSIRGKTHVSIRLSEVDGEALLKPKLTIFPPAQWSIFRKSIPAIEEAIVKVESKLSSELQNKQIDDKPENILANTSKQNGDEQNEAEPNKNYDVFRRPKDVATRKQAEDESMVASAPQRIVPIGIIRFDGKNYQQWADRMESYLDTLKVSYVLSEPCPSAVGVPDRELAQILPAVERWADDDHICRQNILNSLCDHLYGHYFKKLGSAKHLWDELKVTYLHEELGANVTLVKKYTEFQIVEEKSIFEQVHEFNQIAGSLTASGVHVEEKFHVNVIISKLPASWKPSLIELMKEEYLTVWVLMNHIKAAEESRRKGNKGEPSKTFGLQRSPMKKLRFSPRFCSICNKTGHNTEQCWYRKSRWNYITNEKDKVTSINAVDVGETEGARADNTGEAAIHNSN